MLALSTSLASAISPSCTHSPWYTYSSPISPCHQNLQRQRRKRPSGMSRRWPLLLSFFVKKQTGPGIPVILVHPLILLPITSRIIVLLALWRQENSARRSGERWVLDHSDWWWSTCWSLRDQLKTKWSAADRLASSSGAGSSYSPQTGINATTSAEQCVIDDFAASNPVRFSLSMFSF